MSFVSLFTSMTAILQLLLNPWDGNDVCNTAVCRSAARRIISDMNPDVKPCGNFYQFACGNFMLGNTIQGEYSRLSNLQYDMDNNIYSLLQGKPKRHEPRIYKLVKQMFHMCMDEKKMDYRGVAPGVEMLKKLGGWPVLGKWDPSTWSFVETAILSWQLGLEGQSLIEFGIDSDSADLTKYVLVVGPPELPIPREYLIKGKKNSVVKKYFQYMVDMAMLYGAVKHIAEEAMEKVLELQIELAKVLSPKKENRGIQQKLKQLTIKELDGYPNKLLDWRKLFEGMVSPIELQDDQRVDFYDLEVIQKVLALIKGYSARTIANHVMWNFTVKISPYLTTEIRNRVDRFDQVLQGTSERPERWQECFTELEGLDVALSSMYVDKFFDKSSRKEAKDIMNRIQTEMGKVLQEAYWMDEETRQIAQKKSANMLHVVGYPDELADIAKVEEHYQELNLNSEDFFEARLNLNIWKTKCDLRKLKKVSPKRTWTGFTTMAEATAYNFGSRNAIVATAGILQEPFYSIKYPSYLNYASIGFTIAHEVTHGFDDEGREFDDEGELKEWWDESSLNKFNEKKQCFIDQYSSFIESVTKRKVNGVLTQGENIADNGGLKLAYRAYRQLAKQLRNPEPGLPGLKQYNNDQLFFINLANTWCGAKPREMIEHDMMTDEHTPYEWRVNGMVMNMPQFGEVFECGNGTPMNLNPEQRCEVW